jgi:hypothetical protein
VLPANSTPCPFEQHKRDDEPDPPDSDERHVQQQRLAMVDHADEGERDELRQRRQPTLTGHGTKRAARPDQLPEEDEPRKPKWKSGKSGKVEKWKSEGSHLAKSLSAACR